MKLRVTLCLFIVFSFSISLFNGTAVAKNPFQAPVQKGKTVHAKAKPPNPIYFKLAMIQKSLRSKLSDKMKEVKRTGSFLPILPLIFFAFIYGVIHAAGPGHGKALAASFLVSRGRRIRDGFFIGGFIAILHGLSAICLVVLLKFILNKSVVTPLEEITHITKLVSYSLILIIGIMLTLKNLYDWYRNLGVRRDLYSGKYDKQPAGALSAAFIIGMIPCPGTVLIMLYALSINMTGIGILLASAQTLGMALTISFVGLIVVAGKDKTISSLDYARRDIADTIEKLLETLAGIAVVAIGALLLLSTL